MPSALPPVWGSDMEALKVSLPGSLLQLASNKWNFVPISDKESCIKESSRSQPKLRVLEVLGGAAKEKTAEDLASIVQAVYIGILSTGEGAGTASAGLKILGMPAKLELIADPAGGNAVSHARLSVQGMAQAPTTIDRALSQLGLLARPWQGGKQPACLMSTPTHASLAAAGSTDIPLEELVGKGAMALVLVAKLRTLIADPTINVMSAAEAAQLLAGLCGGLGDRADALTVSLASGPHIAGLVAAGRISSIDQLLTIASRDTLLRALGSVLDAMPPPILAATTKKISDLTGAGFRVDTCGIGPIILTLLAEQDAADALVSSAPAPAATPAKPTAPSGSVVSPRDALIAKQQAQLDALRKGASSYADTSPPEAAPAQTALALSGMEFIRPISNAPASAATDLQLLVDMGGEPVARKIALLAGNLEPVIIMTGSGSGSSAIELAADFESILARARAAHPGDARLFAAERPTDTEEAGSRLRVVFRLLSSRPDTQHAPPASAPDLPPPPRARFSGEDNLTVVSESASATRIARACSGAVLNTLTSDDAFRKAAAHEALNDPIAEARRNIELHGVGAQLFFTSSGETNAKLAGPIHPRIVAARTGWVALVQLKLEEAATITRVKKAAAETLSLRADVVAVDMTWTPIQKRYGGLKPTVGEWRSGRLAVKPTQGRWGTMDGPLAYADCERAAVAFAPLLIMALHEVAGGPPPAEPTLGLVPLVQATVGITDEARIELLDEALEKVSQAHHARCSNPSLPPADAEAIFLDCRTRAVMPIESTADASAAGAAAGVAAATAILEAAGLLKKRTAAEVPLPEDGVVAQTGKTKTQQRKERKTAGAKKVAEPPPSPGAAAPVAATPAAVGKAAAAALGSAIVIAPKTSDGGTKPAPLAAGEPQPGSISVKDGLLSKTGMGLVEMMDRMHFAASTDKRVNALPCGWLAALGTCKANSQGNCPKCKIGTPPDADVLSRAKAACCAELLAKLPVAGAVASAN